MGNEWKRIGSLLGFLLVLPLLLSLLIDPVVAGSRREQNKKVDHVKRLSPSKGTSLNSTRNARQIPEIPALYSAPKTPDIPALYSAPKSNQDQNEVDYDQGRATTEVSISMDEEDAADDTSSEDIQYGVPTEGYLPPKEAKQEDPAANEDPTDSPAPTARTNEVDSDEDSYSSGYGNRSQEPGSQYGAPNPPSSQYGPPGPQYLPPAPQQPSRQQTPPPAPAPPVRNSQAAGNSRSGNKRPGANRRPSDQQQIENNPQPMTQMRADKNGGGQPEAFYLPQSPPQQQQPPQQRARDSQDGAKASDANQYEPASLQFLPPNQQKQSSSQPQSDRAGGEPQRTQQNNSPAEGYSPSGGGAHPQDLSQQRSGIYLPPQQQPNQDQGRRNEQPLPQNQQQQQQQGQYFGRDNNQPSSFYGPPGVNHFDSGNQEELEGLNEKIVDAELLQRVQQIIEDHERQQKVLLDKIQKDNEKALSSGSFPSAPGPSSSSQFSGSGNELNGPNDFSPPRSSPGYNSDFNSPNYNNYKPDGIGSGGGSRTAANPVPVYGVPAQAPNSRDFSNEYPSSRSTPYGNGNSQPSQGYSQPERSSARDDSSSSASSYPGDYNSVQQQQQQPGQDSSKLSADVEYQKAVLSTHFTETQPDPQYGGGGSGNSPTPVGQQGQGQNQLNEVAGPGEEYLPPAPQQNTQPQPQQQQQQQQQQQYDDTQSQSWQNPGYSTSFPADPQVQIPAGKVVGGEEGYSVKVGAGILVADDNNGQAAAAPQVSPSYVYGPPLDAQANPGQFQGESQHQGNYQQQQAYLPPQSPPSNIPFWSRTEPQPIYGVPMQSAFGNGGHVSPGNSESPQNKYSAGANNFGFGDNGANQDSFNQPQQYSAPPPDHQYTTSTPFGAQQQQQPQQQQQTFQPFGVTPSSLDANGNAVMVEIPRPIYGVPLAPVISLDSSDNNLQAYNNNNNNPGGVAAPGQGKPTESYSPDAIKISPEYSLAHGLFGAGQLEQAPNTNNYLPPTQYNTGGGNAGSPDLSNSLNFQSPSNDASYGIPDNNPSSSSSSSYLSIQGHNGNSNNHIYNINHNGYESGVVRTGSRDDGSSIIIPGLSNTFTLPIYDYSPSASHEQSGGVATASSSTSPVVVPLEHLLQLQQLPQFQAVADNSPIFYGNRRQDNFRVSRRALSKKASVSPAAALTNPNQKQLSTRNPGSSSTSSPRKH